MQNWTWRCTLLDALLWRNLLLLLCQGELVAADSGLLRQFLLPGAIFKVFYCYFTADNVLVARDG